MVQQHGSGGSALSDGFSQLSNALHYKTQQMAWADPADWITSYFYTYDTEKLLGLYPVQYEPMRYMLRRDELGRFAYSTMMWSWIKKSAKSTIVASIVDWFAYHKPKSRIRLVGNDLKQADSRVGEYLRESIKIGHNRGYEMGTEDDIESAALMQEFRANTYMSSSNYTIEYPNGSRIEMVPVDPTGEAGGNDDVIVFSELWGWKHKKHLDMWTETTIPPTRFGYGFRLIDTYAGFEGESPILEQLYENVVNKGTKVEFPNNKECYESGSIFSTWVTEPTLPWQTKAYYDSEKALLDPKQYKRMHRNEWTSSTDSFIDIDYWDACASDDIAPPSHDVLIVAMDAGVKKDTFAITVVGRYQSTDWIRNMIDTVDPRKTDVEPDLFTLHFYRNWNPAEHGGLLKFDGYDGSPADYMRWLVESYDIGIVAYDEHQLVHFASEMQDELDVLFMPFQQGKRRELADAYLRDTIIAKRIFHDGDKESQVRQHIKQSNKRVLGMDRGIRIVKKNDNLPIDLNVSLSMAVYTAKEYLPK